MYKYLGIDEDEHVCLYRYKPEQGKWDIDFFWRETDILSNVDDYKELDYETVESILPKGLERGGLYKIKKHSFELIEKH